MTSLRSAVRRHWQAWLMLLLGSGLSNLACGTVPVLEWQSLQRLRTELLQHRSAEYVPEDFRAFDRDFERIHLRYRLALAQSAILRDVAELEQDLSDLTARARAILEETLQIQDRLRLQQADEQVILANALLPVAGSRNPEMRRRVTSLSIRLNEIRDLWTRREYLRAQPLLDSALAATEELVAGVEQAGARLTDPDWIQRWKSWADETITWSRHHGKPALIVDKQNRLALVFRGGRRTQQLPIELGWNAPVDKLRAGDGATPEGRYRVVKKKGRGETKYFRALLLDYPNAEDRIRFRQAREAGLLEPDARIGGLIEIHGDGGLGTDWTQGCVALENGEMKQLYDLAYPGMPVTIVGRYEP